MASDTLGIFNEIKENILIQNSEIIQGIFIMIIFIAITFISQLIFSNHWEGNRENY